MMSAFKNTRMYVLIAASGILIASNAFALATILSPEEGQVFYGATASLSVKLQHTPGYDVGVGFEARQLYIPGQWPDTWKNEQVQVLNKNEISPGITIMNVVIPKGGSWRMRASQQPKQSPVPGVSGPLREFLVIAPGQKTAAATISASPVNYTGKCPAQIYFNGKVGSAIKGNVQYQFIRSWDSVTTPLQTLQFDAPGAVDVTTNFPVDPQQDPSTPPSGWVAIKIAGSTEVISNHADFKVSCQYPDLEVLDIIGISDFFAGDETSYAGWKVKFRNKGSGDAEPADVRLRCEAVAGSGPAGLNPVCPKMFQYTAMSLDKLAAGKEMSMGFFPASFTEKWQAGKYRIIAEVDYNNKAKDANKSNNQKTIEVSASWFPITDVQITSWTAHSYEGTCPKGGIPLMSGELSVNGSQLGKVQYQYVSNLESGGKVYEHIFTKPGEKFPVGIQTATSATTPKTTGWYQLKVLSPVVKESAQAAYSIECVQLSIDPNLMKSFSVSLGSWKSLEKMSLPPQACQGCVSTYNQIAGIDQKSMPLVQEGEGLLGAGAQDKTKELRLNQIKTQLDANMVQRKTLLNQYNSQLSSFQMMQKRPRAPVGRKGINTQP